MDFLRILDEEALPFAVIGGCAVGAYARLRGETVLSADLDIYVPAAALDELLGTLEPRGAVIVKRPQARAVPVAVLHWHGKEVNVITSSAGLAAPEIVIRGARQLELSGHDVTVPLAEPFDMLSNELAVRRDKDLPHIDLLERFVEEELVVTFCAPGKARERLEPLRRYLSILGPAHIPTELGDQLIGCANSPPLRRFLVNHLGTAEQARQVVANAPDAETSRLETILARRKFE